MWEGNALGSNLCVGYWGVNGCPKYVDFFGWDLDLCCVESADYFGFDSMVVFPARAVYQHYTWGVAVGSSFFFLYAELVFIE